MISIAKLLQNTKFFVSPRLAVFQSANFSTSIEEKLGLKPKPKRPLSPFFRFLASVRPQILAKNPKMRLVDVVRDAAKQWPSVDESKKKKLTEEYLKERTEYAKQLAAYESKLTVAQKEDIKMAKKDRTAERERRAIQKKIRDNNRPKKPATGYLRFQTEQLATRGDMDKVDFMRKTAAVWRELPEAKRNVYIEKYKADVVKYRVEQEEWEKKMLSLGNTDLVRKSALIEQDENRKSYYRPRAAKSD